MSGIFGWGGRSRAVSSLRPFSPTPSTSTPTPDRSQSQTPIPIAPVDSTPPVITGTAQKGQVLSCSTGGWLNTPTNFTYQWFSGTSPIALATASTYTLTAGDVGASISCNVTASNVAGSSTQASGTVGPVTDIAPVNTGAPAISGTPTVGQTLSCSTGSWLNSPTSYAYQWLSNGAPMSGVNGSTYTLVPGDNGANISCSVTATNSGGSTSATSNSVGPVGSVNMAKPTLTNYSALGTAPLVLQWSDTDYVVGLYGQLQIASDSAFTSITQNIVFFIDGDSWARLSETTGLNTPSGTYYARIRTCRDNDSGATTVTGADPLGNAISFTADVSAWSATFSDTINVATTALYNAPNTVNQSQYAATSGTPPLHEVGNAFTSSTMCVRATAAKTGHKQFDVKWTTMVSNLVVGVEDRTTDLSVFATPGKDNAAGVCAVIYNGGANIYKGGSLVQTPTMTGQANGDVYPVVFDSAAGTVQFFHNTTQIGTTLTGVSLAAWNAFLGSQSNDSVDVNFGQTTITNTGTGATMYG